MILLALFPTSLFQPGVVSLSDLKSRVAALQWGETSGSQTHLDSIYVIENKTLPPLKTPEFHKIMIEIHIQYGLIFPFLMYFKKTLKNEFGVFCNLIKSMTLLDVSKNRGILPPKMDGENNGSKPMNKWMIWGEIFPIFLVQHPIPIVPISIGCFLQLPPSQAPGLLASFGVGRIEAYHQGLQGFPEEQGYLEPKWGPLF